MDLLEEEFLNLEKKFFKIDTSIKTIISDTKPAINYYDEYESVLNTSIEKSRSYLIDQVYKQQELQLKNFYSNFSTNFLVNEQFDLFDNKLLLKLIENYFNKNQLYLKLKYIDLFIYDDKNKAILNNPTETRNIYIPKKLNSFTPKCQKLILSKHLHLNLIEFENKKIYFQIKNDLNQEIYRSNTIILKYYQTYQVLSHGFYVSFLIKDDLDNQLILYNYDEFKNELRVVKQRIFQKKINLHSINKYEIVCMINSKDAFKTTNRYMTLSYELETMEFFGQNIDRKRPFYLADSSLIQLSINKIYIYNYDIKNSKHMIKILNRGTGLVEKCIHLKKNTKFNNIKLDSANRLVIKFNDDTISYYDSNGEFIFELKSNYLNCFKCFDFISNNQICLFNSPNRINFII